MLAMQHAVIQYRGT
uniref:Uncharacterized protein n=1 Tax=Moniliophthora roreri TaxID=221103 RepID=A0A0W0G2B6_MONRR